MPAILDVLNIPTRPTINVTPAAIKNVESSFALIPSFIKHSFLFVTA
jgi:hypothetical protein